MQRSVRERERAWAWARQRGWIARGELPGGRTFVLVKLVEGQPRYYVSGNARAARSTAADRVRDTAPYQVDGTGFTVGIWDGGAVRATHQEFGARVRVMDDAAVHWHATHVGGTIGALGIDTLARGMAPGVGIDSYEWENDLAEMTSRAATGPGQVGRIHLSNHSYGYLTGWDYGAWSGHSGHHFWGWPGERESRWFGQYTAEALAWDALHYEAEYYLAFKAAGNDRNDAAPPDGTVYYSLDGTFTEWIPKLYDPATDPPPDGWDQGGYDTMDSQACSKNILTVGAVNDAVSGGLRAPSSGTMSPFSGWGPTDDGRVKPDIVANGIQLRSSYGATDDDYSSASGTSMATPNATGSAVLLLDYFNRLFPGQAMRASTLKGLILHTADDLGAAGPDYAFGWGLMNTEAAAAQIKAHAEAPARRRLFEGRLAPDHPGEGFAFPWDGVGPIRATLCWTDPPGPERMTLDDRTPVLVNDLDLRLRGPGGTPVHEPYVLDQDHPANPARNGDNVVDNVEQVVITSPVAGTYTLEVTHKGVLSGGHQDYSLILSGQVRSPPPTAVTILSFQSVCDAGGAATLEWTTGVESDVLGFHVEQQHTDGAWWRLDTGIIPATGSTRPSDYVFEQRAPAPHGTARYRLIVVDLRGTQRVVAQTMAVRGLAVSVRRIGEQLFVEMSGSPGRRLVLECATDLIHGPWRARGAFLLDETGAGRAPLRSTAGESESFYRLRSESPGELQDPKAGSGQRHCIGAAQQTQP